MLLPEEQPREGEASILEAASAADELAAVADWARRNSADENFRAWVCVPDLSRRRSEVIDAFDAELAPRRFGFGTPGPAGYAVAGGSPLAEYAPVRSALQLLNASVGSVSSLASVGRISTDTSGGCG